MLIEAGLNAAVEAAEGHHEKPLRAWEVTALRAAITAYLASVQGEQKPVAWRYRWKLDGEWTNWRVSDHNQKSQYLKDLEEFPLYTHPVDRDSVEAGGWRTMDSAPRGEDILVGGRVNEEWKWSVYCIRDEFWREDWEHEEPTHWQHLPTPPASALKGGA